MNKKGIFSKAIQGINPKNLKISSDSSIGRLDYPSNQNIVDFCASQYGTWQDLVDFATNTAQNNTNAANNLLQTLSPLQGQSSKQLPQDAVPQFNDLSGGIFGDVVTKAQNEEHDGTLISTFGLGVEGNVEVIGGFQGSLGVCFQPNIETKGYLWQAGDLGLEIALSASLTVVLSSLQPKLFSGGFVGLLVGAPTPLVPLTLAIGADIGLTKVLFFAPAIGIGIDIGASVMIGQLSNF